MRNQRLYRGRPWLAVVEERSRTESHLRTGSDAFWEFYMFDVSADMYDETIRAHAQPAPQSRRS